MDTQVTPEPTDDESEAILLALERAGDGPPVADESPWRRAALDEATEGLHP